jgi:hypothetical protein
MIVALKGAASFLMSAAISVSVMTNSTSTNSDRQTQQEGPREQTEFGADSDLDRPIPLPKAALDALRSALKATPEELPGEELKASEIHLADTAETDLIVPRLAGSHTAFFYILRQTASSYKLIFDSGGDAMTVLQSRSHGYRDVKVWGFTQAGRSQSTVIYKFNGVQYVRFSEKTENTN